MNDVSELNCDFFFFSILVILFYQIIPLLLEVQRTHKKDHHLRGDISKSHLWGGT